jgi:hemerythrin-like domain-containing protein
MTKKKSAIEVLEEDHERVRTLLDRLVSTSDRAVKSRERIIEDLHLEIEAHTAIEEEIFYPAFRAAADDHDGEELYFESLEEHHLAGEYELPRVLDLDAGSIEFAARANVLADLLMHHLEEEEERMFPRARELFDDATMKELGDRMMQRKRELMRELKHAA